MAGTRRAWVWMWMWMSWTLVMKAEKPASGLPTCLQYTAHYSRGFGPFPGQLQYCGLSTLAHIADAMPSFSTTHHAERPTEESGPCAAVPFASSPSACYRPPRLSEDRCYTKGSVASNYSMELHYHRISSYVNGISCIHRVFAFGVLKYAPYAYPEGSGWQLT